MTFKNDFDIEDTRQPPELVPQELECIICEMLVDEEDCRQEKGKCICIWCISDIAKVK